MDTKQLTEHHVRNAYELVEERDALNETIFQMETRFEDATKFQSDKMGWKISMGDKLGPRKYASIITHDEEEIEMAREFMLKLAKKRLKQIEHVLTDVIGIKLFPFENPDDLGG